LDIICLQAEKNPLSGGLIAGVELVSRGYAIIRPRRVKSTPIRRSNRDANIPAALLMTIMLRA
jgi:hypothetical protein